MATTKIKVALMISSTRSPRVGLPVAEWVTSVINPAAPPTISLSTIDLADYLLQPDLSSQRKSQHLIFPCQMEHTVIRKSMLSHKRYPSSMVSSSSRHNTIGVSRACSRSHWITCSMSGWVSRRSLWVMGDMEARRRLRI